MNTPTPVTLPPLLAAMVAGTLNGVRHLTESRNVVPGAVLMQTPIGLKARHSASTIKWNDPRAVVRSIELLRLLAQQANASKLVAVFPNWSEEPAAAQPSGVIIYVEVEGASWEGHCEVKRASNGMLELDEAAHLFPSCDVVPLITDGPSLFWPMLRCNVDKPLPGRTETITIDDDPTPQGAD